VGAGCKIEGFYAKSALSFHEQSQFFLSLRWVTPFLQVFWHGKNFDGQEVLWI
jgi:hypothetical protein